MAKKKPAKKHAKKAKVAATPTKKTMPWHKWVIISVPLIVGLVWLISLLSVYKKIPLVYAQASPTGVMSLIGLVFAFIVSYGAFVFIEFNKKMQEI